jgi:hypothetical protein
MVHDEKCSQSLKQKSLQVAAKPIDCFWLFPNCENKSSLEERELKCDVMKIQA